ncbi:MAG: hypothetical protein J2P48_23280 [Alphaproteobacteria bacterium]|nr:hypothetical protein [Alphaproteobacteria bacterium]
MIPGNMLFATWGAPVIDAAKALVELAPCDASIELALLGAGISDATKDICGAAVPADTVDGLTTGFHKKASCAFPEAGPEADPTMSPLLSMPVACEVVKPEGKNAFRSTALAAVPLQRRA